MKNALTNATRLVSTPGMIGAYFDWVSKKVFSNNSPPIRSVNGTSIVGFPSFSEYWAFYNGLPEAEEKLLRNCLSNANCNSVAIDIGANLGIFTVALANLGYSHVHAFEPIPDTFKKLISNIERNNLMKQVHLNCSAIGKEEGLAEFKIFEKSPAINRMVAIQENQQTSMPKDSLISNVEVVSLDEYCSDHNIDQIDFLKIDVEGMEPLVVVGAKDIFSQKRALMVLIEICPSNLNELGFSVSMLNDLFEEIDYKPYRLTKNGEVGKRLFLKDLEAIRLENVVLLP